MINADTSLISCPVCGGKSHLEIFKKQRMPRYNLERHHSRESALNADARPLNFVFCTSCFFCFNAAFNPAEMDYAVDYESSRGTSAVFQNYLQKLIFNLKQAIGGNSLKNVIEIGSGDGNFLTAFRKVLEFAAIGYDPSIRTSGIGSEFPDVIFKQEYFNPSSQKQHVNLMVLRHVLEHQASPLHFLNNLAAASEKSDALYIEVPAWEWIAYNQNYYLFSYEHCSYFSKRSLEYVFKSLGFTNSLFSFGFGNEYIQAFGANYNCSWQNESPAEFINPLTLTEQFIAGQSHKIEQIKSYIKPIAAKSVLWGAAGKGTNFLNRFDFDFETLPVIIDKNPERHGNYIPLTAQQVRSPEDLKQIRPEFVLITNELYLPEIKEQVKSLGLEVKYISIDKLQQI